MDVNPNTGAWYPDPHDRGREIYWDGSNWTGSSRQMPSQVTDTPLGARIEPVGYPLASAQYALLETGQAPAPTSPVSNTVDRPGSTTGFVLGIVAILLTPVPLFCVPVGVVGWVKSQGALKELPKGKPGRKLATAGLILSITAIAMTTLFTIFAIPGMIQRYS